MGESRAAITTVYQACLAYFRADHALRTAANRVLGEFKISMMEWLLLGVVSDGPKNGITLSHIAVELDVSQPQVTALMNRVLDQKLVRQRVHKTDRRSRTVVLTPRGMRTLDAIETAAKEYTASMLGDVPREQLDAYLLTVRQVAELRKVS